jgi:hypothetical protein
MKANTSKNLKYARINIINNWTGAINIQSANAALNKHMDLISYHNIRAEINCELIDRKLSFLMGF